MNTSRLYMCMSTMMIRTEKKNINAVGVRRKGLACSHEHMSEEDERDCV